MSTPDKRDGRDAAASSTPMRVTRPNRVAPDALERLRRGAMETDRLTGRERSTGYGDDGLPRNGTRA